jgi:hypothetical protein
MMIVGALAGFLALFLTWRHVQPGGILFYQGVVVAIVVSVALLIGARLRQGARWSVAIKDASLVFLLAYAFLFTVPTTVDRSYSVRMLTHLAESPQGLTREDIGRFYASDFLEQGGVDKRLAEQLATGTVVEREGRYVLTDEGKGLAATFRVTCVVFACQRSL